LGFQLPFGFESPQQKEQKQGREGDESPTLDRLQARARLGTEIQPEHQLVGSEDPESGYQHVQQSEGERTFHDGSSGLKSTILVARLAEKRSVYLAHFR